jgi:hypothetical protein
VIEKRKRKEKGKAQKLKNKQMMIMRNSDPSNQDGNRDEILVACGDPFTDVHGDRTGVARWGYDEKKRLFYVRRNSNREEYFKFRSQFHSFTAVGLQELIRAPFFNPSNDVQATNFVRFLERQAKRGFPNFRTAKARITRIQGILDENGNTYTHVMWPPTKKEKVIPMAKPLPDGSLRTIEFWVYDSKSFEAVIKIEKNCIRVRNAKDLVMFREHDIKILSRVQITVLDPSHEEAAKEYTAMVAHIINKRFWAGELDGMDVRLIDLSR